MKQTLEAKRKHLFCVLMARGFSPEEAAGRAGYPGDGAISSAALLQSGALRRKIARLSRELRFFTPAELARAALERLVLDDGAGVAPLLCGEEECGAATSLFGVAEVKRPRGGGAEVKFCDRLKALSLLAALESGEVGGAGSLLAALEDAAKALGPENGGGGDA